MSKFNEWNQPRAPLKPRKTLKSLNTLLKHTYGNYTHIKISDIPSGTINLYCEMDNDELNVTFYGEEKETENPNYNKMYEQYQKDLSKFNEEYKVFTELKKQFLLEEKVRLEKLELEQYNRLKLKYDSGTKN